MHWLSCQYHNVIEYSLKYLRIKFGGWVPNGKMKIMMMGPKWPNENHDDFHNFIYLFILFIYWVPNGQMKIKMMGPKWPNDFIYFNT